MATKPQIHIIGTGGTIAGVSDPALEADYESGQIETADLLSAIQGLNQLADIQSETLFSTGSEDLGPTQWRTLAQRIEEVAIQRDIDGIVITHGTDTLEEAALFLDLVCKIGKPVVMTAAIRPSTALSPDGPANIHRAVRTVSSASPRLTAHGVLVAMNGLLLPGWQTVKTSSVGLGAFQAYPGGPVGRITHDRLILFGASQPCPAAGLFHDYLDKSHELAKVGIAYLSGGCGDQPLAVWEDSGCQGLVIAGFGAGTMPVELYDLAYKKARQGMMIIVSSRVGQPIVLRESARLRRATGMIASSFLNPQKSALLLSLALGMGMGAREITDLFRRFHSTT